MTNCAMKVMKKKVYVIFLPSPTTTTFRVANHNLETTEEFEGNNKKRRKRHDCKRCYRKLELDRGRLYARKNVSHVSTFCNVCPDKPFLCINCFEAEHHN